MRYTVIALAALGTILLYLLALSTGNESKLDYYFWWFLGLNVLLLALLMVVVTRQLLRLRARVKQQVFGAKLTQKLAAIFAVVALVPGLLVFALSTQFLTRSIESWFDIRVGTALNQGLELGRNALNYMSADLSRKAGLIEHETAAVSGDTLQTRLDEIQSKLGLREVVIYASTGKVLAFSGQRKVSSLAILSQTELKQLARQHQVRQIENEGAHALTLKVQQSYTSLDGQTRILQVCQLVPENIANNADQLERARNRYADLLISRSSLKTFYMLTLALAVLLALTAAVAFALFISERLSAPLSELAAGTRAVAQGDFSKRHPVYRRDELGVLTTLFNRMTQQLEEARKLANKSRDELEGSKLYIESILANLSAGVMAFNPAWQLSACNHSAGIILGIDFKKLNALDFHQWPVAVPGLAPLVSVVQEHAKSNDNSDLKVQLSYIIGQVEHTLLVRGAHLPSGSERGYVVVFDDITELAKAQRDAAWGEVAKRLAHEIRNPLTPIQLSAERLAMKLEGKLAGNDRDILRRATDTIIHQVGALKNMVDAFRDYARAPKIKLAPLDINQLVKDVIVLYESNTAIRLQLGSEPLMINADAALLRQVLHNLLQNAQDAVSEEDEPKILVVTQQEVNKVVLAISDNGAGFAYHMLQHAFEPYVTSKAKGTGLGLAVVKKIIEEHNGQVCLENLSPCGAQITLALPLLEV